MEAGDSAEGGDDAAVEAAAADGGVAEVDDRVSAGVEVGQGGSDGHGLAGADFAGDDAQGAFADAPVDAGDGFGGRVVAVQHLRRKCLAEWGFGEAVVGFQLRDHADTSLSSLLSWLLSSAVSPLVPGSCSWPGTCPSGRSE